MANWDWQLIISYVVSVVCFFIAVGFGVLMANLDSRTDEQLLYDKNMDAALGRNKHIKVIHSSKHETPKKDFDPYMIYKEDDEK